MSAASNGSRRRWLASATGAMVVFGMVWFLGRVPRVPAPPRIDATPHGTPSIEVATVDSQDRTLQEATIMHDQTPLFLPTERNVALRPLPPLEAGGLLLDRDQAKLAFTGELTLRIPAPMTVPERLADAVWAGATPAPLHGFGRQDTPIVPLEARGGVVEVLSARTNEQQLVAVLPVSARPPTEKLWRPIEFAAVIEAAGLVGSIVVTERSDTEEVERYFRNYLAQTWRVGERLPPGFYRIIVGP